MTIQTREQALALDRDDALAPLRKQFALPAGVIYLDGNSLGAAPRACAARAQAVINDEWARDLIGSWNSAGWFALPKRLGNQLAPGARRCVLAQLCGQPRQQRRLCLSAETPCFEIRPEAGR